jgi:3D (Asp-Asp-Asp) domain-containing protein
MYMAFRSFRKPLPFIYGVMGTFFLLGCNSVKNEGKDDVYVWDSILVTATAYNSLPSQTTAISPNITAWGDTLFPGMKVIAVSRDLLAKGLKHNTKVRLDTFAGIYLVKDKMHTRWRKRVDIYMGTDRRKALNWGRRKLTLYYAVKKDSLATTAKAP